MKYEDIRPGDMLFDHYGYCAHLVISVEHEITYKKKRPRDKKPRVEDHIIVLNLLLMWSKDVTSKPRIKERCSMGNEITRWGREVYRDGQRLSP
jgi:hypothetical protein